MSVVGIDFGAQSTKIGVARNKGIDIVRAPRPPYHIRDIWKDCADFDPFSLCYRSPMKSPTDRLRMSWSLFFEKIFFFLHD